MTKKDYIIIAHELNIIFQLIKNRNIVNPEPMELFRGICGQLTIGLKRDNQRFNIDKFYQAIGISELDKQEMTA